MKPVRRMQGWCAVLTLTAIAAVSAADDLGRLFFSAAERAALDARRATAAQPPPAPVAPPGPTAPVAGSATAAPDAPPVLTVNGVVTRSQGPATVWVNGVAQDARQARVPGVESLGVIRDTVEFRFAGELPAQRLRAGETLDFGPAAGSAGVPETTPGPTHDRARP